MSLIFVDCEAAGPCPSKGQLTEFSAIEYRTRDTFYARIVDSIPSSENPAIPVPLGPTSPEHEYHMFEDFNI